MPHPAQPPRSAMFHVEQILIGLLFLGVVAMLSLPAARGVATGFGWMPLWLLAMPAAGLAMARFLRLSRRRNAETASFMPRRRRPAVAANPRRRETSARRGVRWLAATALR